MLLVAITGPVGSQKTTILHDFALSLREQGQKVDGFVSLAGKRWSPDKGADSYAWSWIKTGKTQPFAARNRGGQFVVDDLAWTTLDDWIDHLPSKQDLIVLDEFGKWEARGSGLMPFWNRIANAKPRMVVVTLRQGLQNQIEEQLGRKFNRVLDAEDSETPSRLRQMYDELKDWEAVGVYGASSGGLECSLGTWLHVGRFPFTGTIMGSLQAAVLALASKSLARKELVVWISAIAAGLKALSPAGSRITPMIAIAMQGFLFMVGATIGRWTKFGFAMGAFLVGLWSALQGILIQYLMLGRSLARSYGLAANFIRSHLGISPPNIWIAVVLLCILNGIVSIGLTLAILSRSHQLPVKASPSYSFRRQLLSWLPLVLVSLILLLAGEQPSSILWIFLRVAAVSLSMFGITKLARRIDLHDFLSKHGLWGPSFAAEAAKDQCNE